MADILPPISTTQRRPRSRNAAVSSSNCHTESYREMSALPLRYQDADSIVQRVDPPGPT